MSKPNRPPSDWKTTWTRCLSVLLDTSLDAAVTMNAEGQVVDWNARAEQIFGWSAAEAQGALVSDLIIPPTYRASHLRGLRDYLKTGEGPVLGRRLELTAIRKDGDQIPVELSVTALPLGEDVLFAAFLRDISDRAEDTDYRKRMAALVDSSYDAIIGKDITGIITSWNRGAEHVYGFTEQEALGQTIDIILPSEVEREEDEIVRVVQTGQRLEQFETERRRKDGKLIPVSVTVSPITDDNGTIIGSSTIERDITEARRHKEELQRAKEAAEHATRLRGEFLANVSHELRTPMNAIIGMTQITLDEDIADDVRDYVQTANDAAQSLLTLLNDILDFSKLESGKFVIENGPFNLRDLMDDTVKTLSAHAFEKGLELACDVDAEAPNNLIGDAVRLRQVLTNLIANAIKFTEQGEVVVAVRTLRKWRQQTRLRFSIRDTGVGIPEADLRRILEPFTQADASSTRRHGGTGLGLTICKELLRLMGGQISIESVSEVGSCFSFELSFSRQDDPLRKTNDFTPLAQLNNMPVLIVDDNETNRHIIADALLSWSMRPDTAGSGEQALRHFDRAQAAGTPYPLVIADAVMPGMDGYSLTQLLANRSADPLPVILMLSASDRREFRQREQAAGISAFLQKPVSQSDLMDAVLRAMNVQVVEHDQAAGPPPAEQRGRPLNVLLAEDTPANQQIVTTILSKRGHSVTVARDGRQAVELCRDGTFDVILMDVQMPVMDGVRATAEIRAYEKRSASSTPIVAMTAHAMPGDRESYLQAGMDAYIAKPIDVRMLIELVEGICLGPSPDESPEGTHELAAPPGDSASATRPVDDPLRDLPTLDISGTLQRLGGDKQLLQDFIVYFDEDSPTLLATLHQAIPAGDCARVRRAAHSLKGLAANFGAARCVFLASQLEQLGKSEQLAGSLNSPAATDLLSWLDTEVARFRLALADHRR